VIGRERSLRFPGITPTVLVQLFLRPTEKEVGSKIFNTVRNLKEQPQMKTIKNFLNDESGMETLEYAVIAGLIALVAVAIYAVGGAWKGTLQNRLSSAASQN